MNGQEQDIERLLKAAAQQEPEPAAPALKQQAWEQLRHMLDGQEAPPPAGKGWWFLLAEVVVLLLVGLLFLFNSGNGPQATGSANGEAGAQPEAITRIEGNEKEDNDERDEKVASAVKDSADKHKGAEEIAGAAKNVNDGKRNADAENEGEIRAVNKNADAVKEARDTESNDETNSDTAKDTNSAKKNPNILKQARDEEKSRAESDKGGKKSIDNAKAAGKIENEGKIKQNENVKEKDAGNEDRDNTNVEIRNSSTASLHLQPVYPGAATEKKLSAVDRLIPLKPHDFPIPKFSPFNLKAAIMAADHGTWAGNLQAGYSFRLSPGLIIRPSAGFTYLTGANNSYEHFYQDVKSDTGTTFKVDTARTYFTLKSTLHANLGIQLVYTVDKWSVFTGITYQYQLMQQGTDSTLPGSYNIPHDSLPRYPDRFNAHKLPGRNFLQWQAGVDYRLSPALRIGLQYNLGWGGSSGKGFVNDVPGYPNRQSLELQVRYYFRRKN